VITDAVDVRQELLGRVRARQASIETYVRKSQRRCDLMANISIVSIAIAAALAVGPTVGGTAFAETAKKGLGREQSSSVWRLLCLASLIVYLVAAISAKLNKSNDLTARISITEASNAALEGLRADVEFSKLSVKITVAEYGQIAARILFVPENSADDDDVYSNDGTSAQPPFRTIDRYRRSTEVIIPGMVIVFASLILVATVLGFVLGGLGRGVAEAGPQINTATQLVLSTSPVKVGDTYSATASGFLLGEDMQFSWTGPTHGTMDASSADSGGRTTSGKIVEKDPPGSYTIIVTGLTSRRTASAGLQVVAR
jgi:hypothetical protein